MAAPSSDGLGQTLFLEKGRTFGFCCERKNKAELKNIRGRASEADAMETRLMEIDDVMVRNIDLCSQ